MMSWLETTMVLAQKPAAAQQQPELWQMFAPMAAIMVLFYFLMIAPQRREQKKRDQLLSAIKKDDRIVTIGGIIGTVANVIPDRNEVVIKVEDSKLRVRRSAIAEILSENKDDSKSA